MKYLMLFVYLSLCLTDVYLMTEKQIKSTANLIRNVCQPKNKVTSAQIDAMHKGSFENDPKLKCYMKCVFDTLQIMKNGKLDMDAAMKQIATLPPKYQGPTTATVNKCKNEMLSSDQCEVAYELAQCWYTSNPELYFLP